MLTAADRTLVSHAVDGSLSASDAAKLRLLLDHSREARRLYRTLRREREALRQLPAHKAPETLLPAVMACVAECNPFETIPSTTHSRRPRRSLLHYIVAASVIAAFSAGVLWSVRTIQHQSLIQEQARALPRVDDAAESREREPQVVLSRIPQLEPDVDPMPEVAALPETAPEPRQPLERPPAVFGAPPKPPLKLESVLVKLPLVASMKDLANDNVRKQVQAELARGGPARIDLFTSDAFKAAELLVATGRAAGVNVILDASAQERLRHRTTTTWLVYTEALTPEQATAWLVKLAAADANVFQNLHLPANSAQDAKDLKDLLGLDAARTKAGTAKPVSEGTLGEISSSMVKEKAAILVSYLPATVRSTPSQSRDVKAWLERRGDKKPGTVPLTIVVR